MVGSHLSVSGIPVSAGEELAARLSSAGWMVICTSRKPGRLARLSDMLLTTWQRRREYSVAHVDVFSGLAFVWAEVVCLALRGLGKPYVLTLHGGNLPSFARRWPRRVSRLLRGASAVTVPSRYLLEQMQPYRRDLQLVPNAVDSMRYGFRVRSRARPHLVWLRSFHQIYNPALAVDVVARIAEVEPEAQLIMVGPDKGDGSLQVALERAAALDMRDRITFTGGVPRTDVPRWLHRGDIFLNTATVDNAPVSLIEAMAAGLCIVSTRVGGVAHLVEDGEEALLVPPGDAAAMTGAVQRVLAEPSLAERLSRNGARKASRFDWGTILPQWESLLQAAAGARPR
jgi:glycosyltransferase involved in cell wall biosynthesis